MIDFEEDIEETQGSEQIGNVTRNSMSWVQKYRPKTLEHFCLEPKLMKIFKEQIENDNIQSCTLVGSPGIGKTTLGLSAPKPLLIDVDFGIIDVVPDIYL